MKAGGESTQYGTPYGSVVFMVSWPAGRAAAGPSACTAKRVAYVYVQAPWSPGFVNPVSAPGDLGSSGTPSPLLLYMPARAAHRGGSGRRAVRAPRLVRLVRRVRRLERATLAVADGDYSVTLPCTGRDEVGRLETHFTTDDPAAQLRAGRRTGPR